MWQDAALFVLADHFGDAGLDGFDGEAFAVVAEAGDAFGVVNFVAAFVLADHGVAHAVEGEKVAGLAAEDGAEFLEGVFGPLGEEEGAAVAFADLCVVEFAEDFFVDGGGLVAFALGDEVCAEVAGDVEAVGVELEGFLVGGLGCAVIVAFVENDGEVAPCFGRFGIEVDGFLGVGDAEVGSAEGSVGEADVHVGAHVGGFEPQSAEVADDGVAEVVEEMAGEGYVVVVGVDVGVHLSDKAVVFEGLVVVLLVAVDVPQGLVGHDVLGVGAERLFEVENGFVEVVLLVGEGAFDVGVGGGFA